jgi:single-strand DNA-binding protein
MSKSVNAVRLLGHVGKAPELRNTNAKGVLVANLSIATNERRKVGAEYKDHTEWHRITAFGKLAEVIRDYVKKGSHVYLEGRLRAESWDDNGSTRYSTFVIAEEVVLLDGKPAGAPAPPPGSFDSYAEDAAAFQRGNPIATQSFDDNGTPF